MKDRLTTDDNLILPLLLPPGVWLFGSLPKAGFARHFRYCKQALQKCFQRTCWPRNEWCSWGWNLLRDEVVKLRSQNYQESNFPGKGSSFSQVIDSIACCPNLDYFENFKNTESLNTHFSRGDIQMAHEKMLNIVTREMTIKTSIKHFTPIRMAIIF